MQWSHLSFQQREKNIGFIWHMDSLFLCLIYDAVRTSTQDSVNNDPTPASISLYLFASSYPRAVLSSNLLNFPGHCACSLWKTCEAVDLSWLVLGTGFYWSTTTCQLTERIDGPRVFWPWRWKPNLSYPSTARASFKGASSIFLSKSIIVTMLAHFMTLHLNLPS